MIMNYDEAFRIDRGQTFRIFIKLVKYKKSHIRCAFAYSKK